MRRSTLSGVATVTCLIIIVSANSIISNHSHSVTAGPVLTNSSFPWKTTGSDLAIPGRIDASDCLDRCTAICPASRSDCISAASSIARTCSPQWEVYSQAAASWSSQNVITSGSFLGTMVATEDLITSYFTSSSTDTDYVITDHFGSTYHPVYVFGSASVSVSQYLITVPYVGASSFQITDDITTLTDANGQRVTTIREQLASIRGFQAPKPYCSVIDVTARDCGRCTIGGGTVQLYYWPESATLLSTASASLALQLPINVTTTPTIRIVTVDDNTMTSPSVYISMQTALAVNFCGHVGANNTGTVLTMRPQDVSTISGSHTGTATGGWNPPWQPDQVSRINYANLGGVVPASIYEQNQNCEPWGCAIIYNNDYNPWLVVPSQLRTMDPAWADCDLNLAGVYDPPHALAAVQSIQGLSIPADATSSSASRTTTSASPSSTVTDPLPSQTQGPGHVTTSSTASSSQGMMSAGHSLATPASIAKTSRAKQQSDATSSDPAGSVVRSISGTNSDSAGAFISTTTDITSTYLSSDATAAVTDIPPSTTGTEDASSLKPEPSKQQSDVGTGTQASIVAQSTPSHAQRSTTVSFDEVTSMAVLSSIAMPSSAMVSGMESSATYSFSGALTSGSASTLSHDAGFTESSTSTINIGAEHATSSHQQLVSLPLVRQSSSAQSSLQTALSSPQMNSAGMTLTLSTTTFTSGHVSDTTVHQVPSAQATNKTQPSHSSADHCRNLRTWTITCIAAIAGIFVSI